MAKVARKEELRRRRTRRLKLRKLRERYLKSQSEEEKGKILAKIQKIHPFYPLDLLKKRAV